MVCGGCSSSSLGEVLYWRARLLRPAQHRTRDFLSPLRCAGSCFFSSSVGQSSQSNQYGPPVAVKGFLTLLNYLFNTSYLTDSYISFTLKLESQQKFCSKRSIRYYTVILREKMMYESVKWDVLRKMKLLDIFPISLSENEVRYCPLNFHCFTQG